MSLTKEDKRIKADLEIDKIKVSKVPGRENEYEAKQSEDKGDGVFVSVHTYPGGYVKRVEIKHDDGTVEVKVQTTGPIDWFPDDVYIDITDEEDRR